MSRLLFFMVLPFLAISCAHKETLSPRGVASESEGAVLKCEMPGITVSTKKLPAENQYETTIVYQAERASATKQSSLFDMVQPVDHPFNTAVGLDMGNMLSGFKLKLGFGDNSLQLLVRDKSGKLPCQIDEEFKTALKEILKLKTKGAM